MSVKAFYLAIALVVGAGQTACAATLARYDIDLRYTGTTFWDVSFSPFDDTVDAIVLDSMALEGNSMGVIGTYGHLALGDVVRFQADVIYPDDPYNTDTWLHAFDNGGRAPSCDLAGITCTGTTQTYSGDRFRLYDWDASEIYGSVIVGDEFRHLQWGPEVPEQFTAKGYFHAMFEIARFEVVAVVNPIPNTLPPSPVPLPLSAALLPLGLGAFTIVRKRRRQIA